MCSGLSGYASQITLTMGLRRANAASAIALSYLSEVWALIIGTAIFHEVPTVLSLLGSAVIIGSTLVLSAWEHHSSKKAAKAAAFSLAAAASLHAVEVHASAATGNEKAPLVSSLP